MATPRRSRVSVALNPATGRAELFAREVAHPRRMALPWPTPRRPIFDQAEVAHHLLEALAPAHCRIGWMPEPGGGDRLEVVRTNLILVELEHAFRRPHMHVGETQIPDSRQLARLCASCRRGFEDFRRGLRHTSRIVRGRHFADCGGGFG